MIFYGALFKNNRFTDIGSMDICYILKFSTHGYDSLMSWIYKLNEMDADYVAAYKCGSTDISKCQMLCKTHNWTKGNNKKGVSTMRSLFYLFPKDSRLFQL